MMNNQQKTNYLVSFFKEKIDFYRVYYKY